jgi:hypothetical protein
MKRYAVSAEYGTATDGDETPHLETTPFLETETEILGVKSVTG